MANEIKSIKAREVLDSRGTPTVEVDIVTKKGTSRAMVPSGASTGSYEALELRDGDNSKYLGKGVLKAVSNVNEIIAKKLLSMDAAKQKDIDNAMLELDGTENKSKLGANATLAVSMAVCKAAAMSKKMPLYAYIAKLAKVKEYILPVPQLNVINGGKHAGQENDIQEHMIMPVGAKNFREAIRMAAEVYAHLKKILKNKFGSSGTLIGDEGGFAPPQFRSIQERLDAMAEAIKAAGYDENTIKFAVDSASSEFCKDGIYTIDSKKMSSGELVDYYADVVSAYPVVSWEDCMAEDDWEGWAEMTKKLGNKIQITGDDLLVTNPKRIKEAIEKKAANSVLIKLNQIGTVAETLEAINMAHRKKWTAVCSHRSGETEDSFLADFVVGIRGGQIKCGAPARSERLAKYNQLIRIEEELDGKARYAGKDFRNIY
ncbi:phosphopyruvate hydratase [Candidatus Woesearchaeota archaeon]|nr:phosphopyruvate hydratase [Candidatus Woesearchaeota archaeon]